MMLWIVLAAFIGFNVYAGTYQHPYWKSHLGVLTQPDALDAHLALARSYWQSGNWPRIETELRIAQTLFQPSQDEKERPVLGISASPLDLLHQWEKEPMRLAKELGFWQAVVKDKPDYRDGFIQLSALSFQLNKPEDAKHYLDEAIALDPNSPVAASLTQLLSQR